MGNSLSRVDNFEETGQNFQTETSAKAYAYGVEKFNAGESLRSLNGHITNLETQVTSDDEVLKEMKLYSSWCEDTLIKCAAIECIVVYTNELTDERKKQFFDSGKSLFEAMKSMCSFAINELNPTILSKLRTLLGDTVNWVEKNPGKTILLGILALLTVITVYWHPFGWLLFGASITSASASIFGCIFKAYKNPQPAHARTKSQIMDAVKALDKNRDTLEEQIRQFSECSQEIKSKLADLKHLLKMNVDDDFICNLCNEQLQPLSFFSFHMHQAVRLKRCNLYDKSNYNAHTICRKCAGELRRRQRVLMPMCPYCATMANSGGG